MKQEEKIERTLEQITRLVIQAKRVENMINNKDLSSLTSDDEKQIMNDCITFLEILENRYNRLYVFGVDE